jgi:tetratricopeptide (TPR) repeat protein
MRLRFSLLAIFIWATPVFAADQLQFAPPAEWVKPLDFPAPSASGDGGATQILLMDAQDKFNSDSEEHYWESVVRVQTSQGLSQAGNLSLAWMPDHDTMTIHKVHIVRDGQVIDVLAKGQTFTVIRRESNLEVAMLDGALTGALQIEGLQVGDIVDLAVTLVRRDPVLKGHAERFAGLPGMPAARMRIRELWPDAKPMRWRATAGIDPPRITTGPEGTELAIDMANAKAPQPPRGAPARYSNVGQIELTDFQSWGDLSALMAPLYQQAATLTAESPLKAEAAAIAAASADPKVRAAAALKLVQDKIRYVFLGMNDGGYVPADADVTWSRRFGDCKGKTALLLALLNALGIAAEPAVVSSSRGDGLDAQLPMIGLFDHILVRATIDGKVFWLDGTRMGDRSLDDIAVPPFKWALPIRPDGAAPEALIVPPFDKPQAASLIRFDASGGLDVPAPVHAETIFRDDGAIMLNLQLANLSRQDIDRSLKDAFRKRYQDIDVQHTEAVFDAATGQERISMDGVANMSWVTNPASGVRRYETASGVVGWKPDYQREPGPDRDAPFAVNYPHFMTATEIVVLPHGGAGFHIDGIDVSKTVAGMEIKRTSRIVDGVFTLETSAKALAPEFPAAQAPSAAATLRALADDTVYVAAPKPYYPTNDEIDKSLGVTLNTADQFLARGMALSQRGDKERALPDLDKAIELNPDSAQAYAYRGALYYDKGDVDRASSDFDAAIRIDPRQVMALRGQAAILGRKGHNQEAADALTHVIALSPGDALSYEWRGFAYSQLRDYDKALADLADAARLNPGRPEPLASRAEILLGLRRYDEALADIDKLIAAQPGNAYAHALRGGALKGLGRPDEARAELDRSIEIGPSPQAYLERAELDSPDQREQSLADIDAALKLNPKFIPAYRIRAAYLMKDKNFDGAIEAIDSAIAIEPDAIDLLIERSEIYRQKGDTDRAIGELDAILARHPDAAVALNNRCWYRGIAGKEFDAALADCDAALKIQPDSAAALDSRGFVHLKAGQTTDAIADYDAALKIAPKQAASLFGRGVAELRAGNADAAQGDLAAARAANPAIETEFESYGVRP